jgi:threonine/homoserine/homoserine lactone efflux protein
MATRLFSCGVFGPMRSTPRWRCSFWPFVPQFIAPTVEHKPLAFLLLGLLFNFNGLWVNLGWALAAAWLARRASRAAK